MKKRGIISPDIPIRTTNDCEIQVAKHLFNEGYEIIKNGWPDFIAVDWKNSRVRFIEVKPYTKRLKPRQSKVKDIFEMIGLKYETAFVGFGNIVFEPDQAGKS